MNKTFITLVFFLLNIWAHSQIPTGYYSSAEGLSGENLKAALYNIIKGHTTFIYTSSSTDVWDILKQTDKDPANPDNVILFYTGWSVNAAQEYNYGSGWSREHVWAKSRGDFDTDPPAGTDAHHLRPADISVNSARNNRWFDNCDEPYLDGGVSTGCFTSSTSWVWQPRDAVKGDAARMIFYMATRYEGENGEPDLEVIDYFPTDKYTHEPIHAKLSTLLQWNLEDPVDDFERNRNEVVYDYQDNRNPFIDHPEYVDMIWGTGTSTIDTEDKSKLILYPNPACDFIVLDIGSNNAVVELYDVFGKTVLSQELPASKQISVSQLQKGIYIYKVIQGDKTFGGKIVIE